ncbi:hypothetical protein [Salinibacterium sp. TMP30]|uniref:hypothetical protein n=1 Tax=Salinibacterium sp. TMP30 TaxID=3138237 RepID=UPI0031387645
MWDEPGTYVETDHDFASTFSHGWDHGIGETITALLNHGMRIDGFVEHRSVPWDALPGNMTKKDDGEYRLTSAAELVQLTLTPQVTRIT